MIRNDLASSAEIGMFDLKREIDAEQIFGVVARRASRR